MTFDSGVQATWGEALAQVRDKVSGMANWAINDDSSAGASQLAKGDYFVLTSPAPAEDIRLLVDNESGGVAVQHGPTWDAGAGTWGDRYEYDPDNSGEFYSSDSAGYGENISLYASHRNVQDFPMQMAAPGRYWLEYVDGAGFAFYFQREEGDGDDGDCFLGMAQVNKAWDYTGASRREAEWVLGIGESSGDNQRMVHMSCSGNTAADGTRNAEVAGSTYEARGMVNPDNNLNNYPLSNSIIASTQYTNVSGEDAIIGDFNMWVNDRSESDTGHKDLIQDANANNIYTILKRNGTPSVAVRMD